MKVVVNVSVKDVERKDWEFLTGLADDLGMTMAQLVHVISEELRGRTKDESVIRSFQRAELELVRDALFPSRSGRPRARAETRPGAAR